MTRGTEKLPAILQDDVFCRNHRSNLLKQLTEAVIYLIRFFGEVAVGEKQNINIKGNEVLHHIISASDLMIAEFSNKQFVNALLTLMDPQKGPH